MTRPLEDFEHAMELGLRLTHELRGVEQRMRESMPDLRAAAYDGERRGNLVWCDKHERDVSACHKAEQDCDGTLLPSITDPTGDAAIVAKVLEDGRDAGARMRRVWRDVEWLLGLCHRYAEDETDIERDKRERTNMPACDRHLRYGFRQTSRTVNGTRVKARNQRGEQVYVLSEPHKLCQWCEDATRVLGRLPTEAEIRNHAVGKRLMVPA